MKSGLMLGVNPNAEREENDYYATHPSAVEIALPLFEKIGVSKDVWEPACGEGHISEVLKKNGYKVVSSDLINRGYGSVKDFLSVENTDDWFSFEDYDIITNPPFKLAEEFVEQSMRLLSTGRKAIFFLKVQFLESKGRKPLFENYPPKYVIINSERQLCAKNAEFEKYTSTTQCYCWFVFEKGYTGDSKLMWL